MPCCTERVSTAEVMFRRHLAAIEKLPPVCQALFRDDEESLRHILLQIAHTYSARFFENMLVCAVLSGHENVSRVLVDEFAVDVNIIRDDDMTLLMHAARVGTGSAVRFLLENGARTDALDAAGRDAIIHAAASGNVDGIRELRANGASTNRLDHSNMDALAHALENASHECVHELAYTHMPAIDARRRMGRANP